MGLRATVDAAEQQGTASRKEADMNTGKHWLWVLPWAALIVVFTAETAGGVMVTSPNGGERIAAGTAYEIQWTGLKDEVKYAVKYSLDGGLKWLNIASNVTGKSQLWKVPKPTTTKPKCLVRVLAYNAQGSVLRSDDSDQPFTVQSVKLSAFTGNPQKVNRGYKYLEPTLPPATEPDKKVLAVDFDDQHSGLECDNSILIEIGDDVNAGSSTSEIQFKVGDDFTIHLLGGAGVFVAGANLLYTLPGDCGECYKSIPADDWKKLTLATNSSNGLQVHRVVLVKSCETVLDVTVDAWLDKYYQKVLDFSVDTAQDKWDEVGHTRVTSIYYAGQDLGQTGAKKYVNADVRWCSEFASYMIRKSGLSTPSGSIGTDDLQDWFQDHDRYHSRASVENGTYTVKPGDYMCINDGGHSVIFRGWVAETPGSQGFDDDSQFTTIEGNSGNAVRTHTRNWGSVDWVGGTQ